MDRRHRRRIPRGRLVHRLPRASRPRKGLAEAGGAIDARRGRESLRVLEVPLLAEHSHRMGACRMCAELTDHGCRRRRQLVWLG